MDATSPGAAVPASIAALAPGLPSSSGISLVACVGGDEGGGG